MGIVWSDDAQQQQNSGARADQWIPCTLSEALARRSLRQRQQQQTLFNGSDPLAALGEEPFLRVCRWLPDLRSALSATAVCTRWRDALESDPRLWRRLLADAVGPATVSVSRFGGENAPCKRVLGLALRAARNADNVAQVFSLLRVAPPTPSSLAHVLATAPFDRRAVGSFLFRSADDVPAGTLLDFVSEAADGVAGGIAGASPRDAMRALLRKAFPATLSQGFVFAVAFALVWTQSNRQLLVENREFRESLGSALPLVFLPGRNRATSAAVLEAMPAMLEAYTSLFCLGEGCPLLGALGMFTAPLLLTPHVNQGLGFARTMQAFGDLYVSDNPGCEVNPTSAALLAVAAISLPIIPQHARRTLSFDHFLRWINAPEHCPYDLARTVYCNAERLSDNATWPF